MENLKIHHFLAQSRANGPGERAVVWVQGCTLGCPGCFNEPTHPRAGGNVTTVDELFNQIAALQGKIEGLTISGGEPLQQIEGVAALLKRLKNETDLSVVLFTGFSRDEVEQIKAHNPKVAEILQNTDVLIAGRYVQNLHIAQDLRGSSNKTLHFLTSRYNYADFDTIAPAEVVITPKGEIILSGIDPLRFTI